MFRQLGALFRIMVIASLLMIASAQTGAQEDPVVVGVLFHSPTCPHCHTVIDNHVPQWEAEFADSFTLILANVTEPANFELFSATCDALQVEDCGGVPMLVIGEEVMIGSVSIPERTPDLVREGLARGGIGLPPVPGMETLYETYLAEQPTTQALPTITAENATQVTLLQTLPGHGAGAWNVTFSPDGSLLASVGRDFRARLWNPETGEETMAVRGGHTAWVIGVDFSPDGQTLVTGDSGNSANDRFTVDAEIHLWDLATGEELGRIAGHEGGIWSVVFSPDGDKLVTASFDSSIRLWDVETGEELHRYKRTGGAPMLYATFSPDGQIVAAGGADRTIRLWDTDTGERLGVLTGHTSTVGFLDFSPDGTLLASAADDSTVRIWDIAIGSSLVTLEHGDWLNSAVFSPDGTLLATGGRERKIMLWDVDSGELLAELPGHRDYILRMAFNPEGTLLASASWDNSVRIWGIEP